MSFYLRPAPVFYGNPCANSAIKYWNKLQIKKSGWKQSVAPGSIYCQAAYIKCASKKKKKKKRVSTSITENKSWKRDEEEGSGGVGVGVGGTETLPIF